MKLSEIKTVLKADFITGEDKSDSEIEKAFAADLMSDVLAFIGEGALLMTGLTNPLVVRTADMVDVAAIVYVRGKKPQQESIDLAKRKGIPLLATKYIMFEACGLLYQQGVRGSTSKEETSSSKNQ